MIIYIKIQSYSMYLEAIFILIISVLYDLIFSEFPTTIHPVVIFGKLIDQLKPSLLKIKNIFSGFLLTAILMLILAILFIFIDFISYNLIINYYIKDYFILIIILILLIYMLKASFSINLLLSSAIDVKNKLDEDIDLARKSLSYLVSRDTNELTEEKMVSATIETLTENITDSVTSPIFYYFLFMLVMIIFENYLKIDMNTVEIISYGVFGAFLYRIINTLDAMVGYKNEENYLIGYIPAKFDDILNYIPSRLTGYIIVLAAYCLDGYNGSNSYKILKRDANNCPSPNSGYTMSASAGALDVRLEKIGVYKLGDKINKLDSNIIEKAVKLSELSILFVILFLIVFWIVFYFLIISVV